MIVIGNIGFGKRVVLVFWMGRCRCPISEGIQECARMLMSNSIVKPEVFNLDVRCYRVDAEGRVEDM